MSENNKRSGRSSILVFLVILFVPGILMVVFSKGCTSKFQVLDKYGKIHPFSFIDIDGKTLTERDLAGEIVIVTTIQNTCPDSCGVSLWQLSEQLYHPIFEQHHNKLKHVRMLSIVTDTKGNPTKITPELRFQLKESVRDYDPKIWTIVEGDAKALFDITHNGVNLFQQKSAKSLGGKAFLECLLLIDWDGEIRLIRLGKSEAMVRDFHDGFTLLEKEYDSSVRNEKK